MTGAPVLVTGGAGFIGSNLADRLAGMGQEVRILDSLSRPGVERNLARLTARHGALITPIIGDIRDDALAACAVAGTAAVFHMAAQVAVTTSLTAPREDFEVNVLGTLNLLEALRAQGGGRPLIFASTNKVYGDLGDLALELQGGAYQPSERETRLRGVDERRALDFHTPYGCSKGAADQYVLDYARSFGVPTCVLRMSCIYGPGQMGTEDQGWVAHFLIRALADETIEIFGDGRQVRDILYIDDAVEAYLAAWRRIAAVAGRAFNLGGGPANAVSLRLLIDHIEHLLDRRARVAFSDWRAGDQRYYVSDTAQVRHALGLPAPLEWRRGIARLADWLRGEAESDDAPAHLAASAAR